MQRDLKHLTVASPLFDVDHLKIANCSNVTIVFYALGNFGQALCIKSCHEDLILTRKSHNCAGIAFIQGNSADGSKLFEQTLLANSKEVLSQPKINLFCVFGRIEQIRILRLKQTERETNTLDIFSSFILSVKGNSTKLGILQAFLQILFERTNKRDQYP